MKVVFVCTEYFQTEDEKVYFFEPLEKEISVEDMQKIVDANEKLVKETEMNGDVSVADCNQRDYDDDIVRLKRADGTISDPMPRERAAFIVAFTLSGIRPEIIENK